MYMINNKINMFKFGKIKFMFIIILKTIHPVLFTLLLNKLLDGADIGVNVDE